MNKEQEEYIGECNCEKIQKLWEPHYADIFYGKCVTNCGEATSERSHIIHFDISEGDCWYQSIPVGYDDMKGKFTSETDAIWLPTFERLIELIKGKIKYLMPDDSGAWTCGYKDEEAKPCCKSEVKGQSLRIALIRAVKKVL